ncbi:hypothetical protein [Mycobacterium sp.]|uniref:hypothetical protein n=1 Tax=Mycobacterium sp. TaxID=1785 RepID=UPI003F9A9767
METLGLQYPVMQTGMVGGGRGGPRWLRALSRASGPLGRMLPLGALDMLRSLQRVALPVYTPALPLAGMNAAVVDRAAL